MQSDRHIRGFGMLGALLLLCFFPEIAVSQVVNEPPKAQQDTAFVRDPDLSLYFPSRWRPMFTMFPKTRSRLIAIPYQDDRLTLQMDSVGTKYTLLRSIGQQNVFHPVTVDLPTYRRLSVRSAIYKNWDKLVTEANLRQEVQRGLLDFRINIPGGQRSAFTTIFGKNELNLQVRGTANMSIGASVQETDNPSLTETERRRVDPIFSQNLKLNIQGTIGDKLKIGTDWDSERTFDFENRLKLVYEGYDDEIIRTIELGNVSMETGNTLIRGGSALFGIKTQLQLGALSITSILSQNEGKGNSQTIKGGTTESTFSKKPADYEDRRHFLIDFYSLFNYEQALSNPTLRQQLYNFSRINIWVSSISVTEQSLREAIALVDLGVDPNGGPPSMQRDIIDNGLLAGLRQGNDSNKEAIATLLGVEANDIFIGPFRQLTQGIDYNLDQTLGIISLRSPLQDRQVLAVSFEYTDPVTGQRAVVGDLDQAGGRLILKMIRQPQVINTDRTWPLTLRNTYSLDQSNLTMEGFKMDVLYTGGNNPTTNLPSIATPMLQLLGLDRVGPNGELGPDNLVDFSTGVLDPTNGVVRFPYLEPFGSRLRTILENNYNGADKDQVIERLVFNALYDQQQENARQSPKNNFYSLDGTVKGGAQDSYNIGFAPVEGSVRVTAGGRTLSEGIDYVVDYGIGMVTITNRSYLSAGQEINIEFESNDLVTVQKKNFTGVRAQYDFSNSIKVGGTWFRLRERPLTDKIRIGEEPINNSVFGFDATADFNAPWLTRAIDRIPLLQTKAPSSIKFSGEWAKLTPGLGETVAVRRERKRGNLAADEERGLSFIDDFEGAKTNVSILNQARWNLSSAPLAIPGLDDMDNYSMTNASQVERARRNDYRGAFSWYMIPQNISTILGQPRDGDEVRQVEVTEIFDRDVLSQDRILTPLDVYFNPKQRGPYNYNRDIETLTTGEPEKLWGGMTATILSGQQDFTINNIEFLEFWVQPVLPNGSAGPGDAQNYDGKLYIDIGTISEDVIPNFQLNTEDGLADNQNLIVTDQGGRSYVLSTSIRFDGEFSTVNQEREDVGLDGAASSGDMPFSEQTLFADYIQHMTGVYANQPEKLAALLADPSNDDYVYYADDRIRGRFSRMQDYFLRYNGYTEGNTPRSTNSTVGNTNRPDSESLIVPGQVNFDDNYYQYEIPWNPGDPTSLSIGRSFIVDSVSVNERLKWYQVRIPLREFNRRVGAINNFQQISYIRFWMSGYREPLTLRFATFEFVGSQWRKAEEVGNQGASTDFKVQTINSEENSNRRPIPYRVPEGTVRPIIRTQQGDLEGNEQSLVLSVTDLRQGDLRMIRRNYTQGMNMINYSNLRMFVHGEGFERRSDAELVIRLGRDLENDYYEYRQPITPTDPRSDLFSDEMIASRDPEIVALLTREIWKPSENSVNIELSVFNQIKQLRALREASFTETFYDSVLIQNAVPGAMVGIKGNPSLERITEIGIGVANPLDLDMNDGVLRSRRGVPSLDAEVWVNELRVSGFTDEGGWAAKGNTSIVMADFATLNGNVLRSTDGFGALDSRMGERDYADRLDYDLSATVNLHKVIPDRFGWSFPVLLSARQSTSTPRFLPNEGDVRLSDFKSAINNDPSLTPDEKRTIIDGRIAESQTYSEAYSINFSSIGKQYSRSPMARLLLDNTKINYVYNTGNSRDPQNVFVDSWNYTTGINYNLTVRNVRLARPFFFLENVPVLSTLSALKIGYMPSSVTAAANLKRNYEERQRRALNNEIIPLQQTHTFTYDSKFGVNYNLTPSIPISFNTTSDLGFNQIGQVRRMNDTTLYDLRPSIDVIRDVVQGDAFPRRNNYNEQYSASWRPNTQNVRMFDWVTTTTQYRGGFTWTNSPEGSGLGARVSNTFSIDQTTVFATRRLLDKFGFYRDLSKAAQDYTNERDQEKQQREAERKRERDQRRAEQEAYEAELAKWKELSELAKTDSTVVVPAKPLSKKEQEAEERKKQQEQEREREQKEQKQKQEGTEEERKQAEEQAQEQGAEQAQQQAQQTPPPSIKEQLEGTNPITADTSSVREPREPSAMMKALGQAGRRTVLAILSLESFDVQYKHSTGSDQSGYRGGSQIFDSFANDLDSKFSPHFGYRLGFDRDLPISQLIANTQGNNQAITLSGSENFKDDLILKTKLSPFKNLMVDLDWSATWDEKQALNTTIQPDQSYNTIYNISGNVGTSVWAFGGGFKNLYNAQLQTAFDDIRATPEEDLGNLTLSDMNRDGRTLLNPETLRQDFIKAYLSGARRTFGPKGLAPIPLPGWNVTLGGLESKIPFANRIVSRISLNHSYRGSYTVGWFYNATGDTLFGNVGVYRLLSSIPEYKPQQINIEKRFAPLVGLSMTWKNGVSTTLSYEMSDIVSLNLDNSQVIERSSQAIKFSSNFQKRGFKLPFMAGTLRNTLDIALNASYSEDETNDNRLDQKLEANVLQNIVENFDVNAYEMILDQPTGDTRITLTTNITYQFSATLKAGFEYRYAKIIPKSTATFKRLEQDFRFNIIVNIRSN